MNSEDYYLLLKFVERYGIEKMLTYLALVVSDLNIEADNVESGEVRNEF